MTVILVLKEALSLLVDGDVIHEAIVVSDGTIQCFPCVYVYNSINLIKKMVNELVQEGLLRPLSDFITIRENKYTIITIPLRKNVMLLLVSRSILPELGAIAESIVRIIKKLSRISTFRTDENNMT